MLVRFILDIPIFIINWLLNNHAAHLHPPRDNFAYRQFLGQMIQDDVAADNNAIEVIEGLVNNEHHFFDDDEGFVDLPEHLEGDEDAESIHSNDEQSDEDDGHEERMEQLRQARDDLQRLNMVQRQNLDLLIMMRDQAARDLANINEENEQLRRQLELEVDEADGEADGDGEAEIEGHDQHNGRFFRPWDNGRFFRPWE